MYALIKSISTKKIYDHSAYTLIIIKIFLLFFFNVYKNERKEHKFWRQKNQKSEFYKNKKVFQIDDFDANKILDSKKEPYGTKNALKYFIGYNDNDAIRPLCSRLPQMTGYAKKIIENVTMSLRVNSFPTKSRRQRAVRAPMSRSERLLWRCHNL